ncbi:ADP-ribosylglycohydrolase family protein [Yimella sp. cx-51]|uniref:ADP-ribosylglycohydrolase family protein n=1 Tax=Yimella sp. cx-51 TaxID=2770551 RepID=UPI00165E3584|nr:ADP-ribosylglycohydrolase family protein [Yimella sp. cx-51]MBC9958378.1 ADP-ribosylglycohydrolase family protein [Yimella sp. cx-51]QTH38217.1 ADP-ribosylglycohydrolase family protein [Yimella sp. cx-51]
MPGHEWPWLVRLKPFQEQHGNPTGTVTAVKDGLKPKGGTSRGVHGIVRVAPLSLLAVTPTADPMDSAAFELASLTHDAEIGASPAVLLCRMLAALMARPDCAPITETMFEAYSQAPVTATDEHVTCGADAHASLSTLNEIAPNDRANRVLAGAMYVASCFENDIEQAIVFASRGKDGDGLAALTGALGQLTASPRGWHNGSPRTSSPGPSKCSCKTRA